MTKKSRGIVTASALLETVMAVPVLGGLFIIGTGFLPLIATFALGIIGIVIAGKNGQSKSGHVCQLFSGVLGVIPMLGWFLRVIAAILLWRMK